jgi:hypothetical protein
MFKLVNVHTFNVLSTSGSQTALTIVHVFFFWALLL